MMVRAAAGSSGMLLGMRYRAAAGSTAAVRHVPSVASRAWPRDHALLRQQGAAAGGTRAEAPQRPSSSETADDAPV